MSLLGFKVCLASEMKANVTWQGQPVEGATITRVVNYDNKDYTTEVHTDSAGNFVLPALYDRTLWKHTPFEVRIRQTVSIRYQNEIHKALELTKRNFDPDGEINNKVRIERGRSIFIPYQFTCELTDEERGRALEPSFGTVRGKCKSISED